MNWYIDALKNYALFEGRAHRPAFWYFVLVHVIVTLIVNVVDGLIGTGGALGMIYALAVLVPGLAVGARRLHDTGRSGWWQLIGMVPLVGAIVLIVLFAQPGQSGDNSYGPNPQGIAPAPSNPLIR